MIFDLFKKKITAEDMAVSLYHAVVRYAVKDDLRDQDGIVILTKGEQILMLVQHIFDSLEKQNLKKTRAFILNVYVVNNHKIETDKDLAFEMLVSLDAIEKIRKFFEEIPPESHDFLKKKFLFDKDLNPIQKTLAIHWYVAHCKIIDSALASGIRKFKVIDEE